MTGKTPRKVIVQEVTCIHEHVLRNVVKITLCPLRLPFTVGQKVIELAVPGTTDEAAPLAFNPPLSLKPLYFNFDVFEASAQRL